MSTFDDFDPELWRDRIERRGEALRWLRRMPCTCQDPVTNQVTRGCALCGGTRWLSQEQEVSAFRALITGEMPRRYYSQLTQFQIGDMLCETMPDEIPLSRGDVVILTTRYEEESQLLTRGSQDVLRAWPVTALVAVTDGATEYAPGTDCVVDADGQTVVWLTTGPSDGANYSVKYRYAPSYDVNAGLPHLRKAVDAVRLPQAVSLRQRTLSQGEDPWH